MTAEDLTTDNVLSVMLGGPQGPQLILFEEQHHQSITERLTPMAVSNTAVSKGSKGSKSNNDSTTKKGFKEFNFGKYRSQAKIRGSHPAYGILKRVLAKDPNKMKDVMPRKMLLRVIY